MASSEVLQIARLRTKLEWFYGSDVDHLDTISFPRIPYFILPEFPASLPDTLPEATAVLQMGAHWGAPNQTWCFLFEASVPPAWKGLPVRFKAAPGITGRFNQSGCEGLLFLNGRAIQGMDAYHPEAVLLEEAAGGELLRVALCMWTGPTGASESYVPRWAGAYRFDKAEVFSVDVATLDYLRDYECLLGLAEVLPDSDPRRGQMIRALLRSLRELGIPGRRDAEFRRRVGLANRHLEELAVEARERKPVRIQAIGHAHIDIGWLWTISQGAGKMMRSTATVLELLRRYPQMRYLQSQAKLIELLETRAPELFRRFRDAARMGRIELNGGAWVEFDCNLPCGESLARQFLYGTRYFQGIAAGRRQVLWLPDSFGFPHSLPQIASRSGIRYFVTSKLSWNETNKPEQDTFRWRGLDGSELLCHFLTTPQADRATYNGIMNPATVDGAWRNYRQKNINSEILFAFGRGDGGGGPTEGMVEMADRIDRFSDRFSIGMGSVQDFMERLEARCGSDEWLPVLDGELYLEKHRGTYTSQGWIKKANRDNEGLLLTAEQLCCLALLHRGVPYPVEQLSSLWKTLLTNQFHDILTGASCHEVYEDARRDHDLISRAAARAGEDALDALTVSADGAFCCYNPLSFQRSGPILLPDGSEDSLVDDDGHAVQLQRVGDGSKRKRVGFLTDLPPMGFRNFRLERRGNGSPAHAFTGRLENRHCRIGFADDGTIASIYHKASQREVLNGKANQLLLFEDKPYAQDAWTLDPGYEEICVPWSQLESSELVEDGPVRQTMRQVRRLEDSVLEQDITLYADSPLILFHTRVRWSQRNTLLKASFPFDVEARFAACEVQFGHVMRPTTRTNAFEKARFEVVAHRFVDLSEANWGVALLNDGRYGHDLNGGRVRISLLRSPSYPDPTADHGEHTFTYALYPHEGDLNHSDVIQQGMELNRPVVFRQGARSDAPTFLAVTPQNVIVEAVKRAEDRQGIVIRMYQAFPQRDQVTVRLGYPIEELSEVSILEEEVSPADAALSRDDRSFSFEIRPFAIRSFLVHPRTTKGDRE